MTEKTKTRDTLSPRTHLKLANIIISPEIIKKVIVSLGYPKTPLNFVHISKVI